MTKYFSLKNKVAVVTGGVSGIGLATAKRFANAGAKVILADLQDGAELAKNLNGKFIQTDVSDENRVKSLMGKTFEAFGTLDILVNNAGVNAKYAKLVDSEEKDYLLTHSINTLGVVFGIKYAVPFMKEGGSIINISSVAGKQGVAYLAPYVASKYAIVGITQTAAIELGDKGIRVNAICPSSVDTPMAREEGGEDLLKLESIQVPLGRIAQPEEVAALIHFLASDDSSFVNGQAINIDGGFTAGISEQTFNKLAE